MTLIDLFSAVREITDDDREVVVIVEHLLRSGRVRIGGEGPTYH